MTNKTKDILKRRYIAPSIAVEAMEPWEMIAGTGGNVTGSGMGGGSNGQIPPGDDTILPPGDDEEEAKSTKIWFTGGFDDDDF